ncbi:MAG: hypothetical protein RJB66_2738 [Pseudomonadota bacterium]|jgi:hypothetical protein
MNTIIKTSLVFAATVLTAIAAQAEKPMTGNFYADATNAQLDPKLPEPFARTKAVQVQVSFEHKDLGLVFVMVPNEEWIDVFFPLVSDKTDACNVRELIAAPPAGSTPYYKDFEIKVIDYSENICDDVKAPAPTVATLKSYEVRHKSTTHSTILADSLKAFPAEGSR